MNIKLDLKMAEMLRKHNNDLLEVEEREKL
jgi:hypothetical protein